MSRRRSRRWTPGRRSRPRSACIGRDRLPLVTSLAARGDRDPRPADQDRGPAAGRHPRHRPPARRDLRADGPRPRPVRRRHRGDPAGPRGRRADGPGARRRTCSTARARIGMRCCEVRKVLPLRAGAGGRGRLDHGPAPRPGARRARATPKIARDLANGLHLEGRAARRLDVGAGLGLRPASTTCPTTRSTTRATSPSAARRAPGRWRRARTSARAAGGGRSPRASRECGLHVVGPGHAAATPAAVALA